MNAHLLPRTVIRHTLALCVVCFALTPSISASPEGVVVPDGVRYVHTSASSNTSGNFSYLDHPALNDNPGAIFHVTHNWNPPGGNGFYDDEPLGVSYNDGTGRWAIIHQDWTVDVPDGLHFNIWRPRASPATFVHTASAANITSQWTIIDHPSTNAYSSAKLIVTQNHEPGHVYNDHAIGVFYRSSESKWAIFNQDIAAMPEGATFNITAIDVPSRDFVHIANPSNIGFHSTIISHPMLNNNPDAIFSVTQNWTAGGGIYNDAVIGVWYSDSPSLWRVFNQGGAPMPDGAAFNISIADDKQVRFVHEATPSNISGHQTEVIHQVTDYNLDLIAHVTQRWEGVYNPHPIGVFFDGIGLSIFNQDFANMPEDALFNVWVPSMGSSVFIHTANAANSGPNYTQFSHPLTDLEPNVIVHVTQNWNPSASAGTYNAQNIGVWYDDFFGNHGVFNQETLTAVPLGADFNISVHQPDGATYVHTATPGNTSGHVTTLDNPWANDNPDAVVTVTPNYNPGGGSGVYNDHPIGVWYSDSTSRWRVFNQDITSIPTSASFNVSVFDPPIFADGFESGNTTAWN